MIAKKYKKIVLCIAAGLLLLALVWQLLLNRGSESARLSGWLSQTYGYRFTAADLYAAQEWNDQSIRALLQEDDLPALIEASTQAGLRSDIDAVGTITLILAHAGNDEVVTLYLLDGEAELGFVQTTGRETVRALGQ